MLYRVKRPVTWSLLLVIVVASVAGLWLLRRAAYPWLHELPIYTHVHIRHDGADITGLAHRTSDAADWTRPGGRPGPVGPDDSWTHATLIAGRPFTEWTASVEMLVALERGEERRVVRTRFEVGADEHVRLDLTEGTLHRGRTTWIGYPSYDEATVLPIDDVTASYPSRLPAEPRPWHAQRRDHPPPVVFVMTDDPRPRPRRHARREDR